MTEAGFRSLRTLMLCLFGMILFLFFSNAASSQSYADLSQVRVEELTDEQVNRFLVQVNKSGLKGEDLDRMLIERGLHPQELTKLKVRLKEADRFRSPAITTQQASTGISRKVNDSLLINEKNLLTDFSSVISMLSSNQFGFDVFHNPKATFEPNLNIPTPKNYIIGTNDQLQIDISGSSEAHYALSVTPEGVVRIPVAGPVAVNGLTIELAEKKIRDKLAANGYSSIRTGRTRVEVTLSSVRSIRVTVIGEAFMPGTFTLPSVASAFHALYACGGPSQNGTLRDIHIIRNNRVIQTIDVYDYLLRGDKSADITLRDQDVIRISGFQTRVEIKGEIRKPGFYDVLTSETLDTLIRFAGGFTDRAYTGRVRVYRNNATQRSISSIEPSAFATHQPAGGDSYVIEPILNRFSNRINLKGAVYRPGDYELKEGMTIRELLRQADGIREDAYLERGTIHRLKDDFSPQVIAFAPGKILSGQDADIPLQRDDRVMIYSRFDLREAQYVKIDGEVLNPGTFLYEDGIHIRDLILMAGGLRESSMLQRIEVSRRLRDSSAPLTEETRTAVIFQQDLSIRDKDSAVMDTLTLQPFDEVVIRPSPAYFPQKNVFVEGEVLYRGKYTLESKGDRISDLVQRAGGLTPQAYVQGAILVRKRSLNRTEQANFEQGLRNLVKQNIGSGTPTEWVQLEINDALQRKSDFVGINLESIIENPGSKYDLLLEDGDTLRVPKLLQTVRVSGEVFYPTLVRYDRNFKFKTYVNAAGGFGDRALRRKSYVVHPNGSINATRSFLFVRNYPSVNPGSEIFVPTKKPKERLGTGAIISIAATLVTMCAVLITALK
jgi:protein involved in polysaccharide export with SLBB domain